MLASKEHLHRLLVLWKQGKATFPLGGRSIGKLDRLVDTEDTVIM